jgi:hypothetical protein
MGAAWQTGENFTACCFETDPEQLRKLVLETEDAMFARARTLGSNADGHADTREFARKRI